MLEMNVSEDKLAAVTAALPAMRSPTVNRLLDGGYAMKAVVPLKEAPRIIVALKTAGATDILEYRLSKVLP